MSKNLQYLGLFIVLILGCLINNPTYSQTKNRIAITSGISSNAVFTSENRIGGGSHEGKGANAFGIRYNRILNKRFSIETGLDYSSNKVETASSFNPGIERTITNYSVRMVSVPVYGNFTFLIYLFVNGGLTVDLETNTDASETRGIDSQSGVGYGFGVGGKYDFKKMTILVNPFFQKHAVLTGSKNPERLGELGVRLGIGYNF